MDINYSPPFQSITVGEFPDVMQNSPTTVYKYIILDGQHRYEAFKRHFQEGRSFQFDIEVINCANINEANYFYELFNSRLEHSNVEITNNLSITPLDKEIQNYISNDSTYFTPSSNGTRPKIRAPVFFDKYMKSNDRKQIKSLFDFKTYLTMKNKEEFTKIQQYGFERIIGSGVSDSIIKKAQNINWWLGLDFNLTWLV